MLHSLPWRLSSIPTGWKTRWWEIRMAWLSSEQGAFTGTQVKGKSLWPLEKGAGTSWVQGCHDRVQGCHVEKKLERRKFNYKWPLLWKDNKKGDFINTSTRGGPRKISMLHCRQRGNIVTKAKEKAEVLNAFFASVIVSPQQLAPWAGRQRQGVEQIPCNPRENS